MGTADRGAAAKQTMLERQGGAGAKQTMLGRGRRQSRGKEDKATGVLIAAGEETLES